jgi:hypothetical protein
MDIKGLNKAAVLAALYNASKPQGMGFMHYDPTPMTEKEAAMLLKGDSYFDYLKGRVMKIDLSKDNVDTWGYNRDNGTDAAEKAVAELVKTHKVVTPTIVATHKANTRAAAADVMGSIHEETTFSIKGGVGTMKLGLSDMAVHLRPAIKRAEDGLRKPIRPVKQYKPVHVKCSHKSGTTVSDFYPLTKRDIKNLLRRAQQTGDYRMRNSIQIRLEQGVKGLVCPRVISGPVAQKEIEVAQLFLNHEYKTPTNVLVKKLYRTMNF